MLLSAIGALWSFRQDRDAATSRDHRRPPRVRPLAALCRYQTAMSDAVLYDRPVLVLDPGMHTAPIIGADVDGAGRFAVTASDDKTLRVWSLADGGLLRTIRLPAGPGSVGKAYAVAISPNGATIAAGGWTRRTAADPAEQLYLFDRDSGAMTCRIDGPTDRDRRSSHSPAPAVGWRRRSAARGPAALRVRRHRTLDAKSRRMSTTATLAMASPSPPTITWRPRVATAGSGSTMPTARCSARSQRRTLEPTRPRLQSEGRPAGSRLQQLSAVALYDGTTLRAPSCAGRRRHRQRQPRRRRLVRPTARRCSQRASYIDGQWLSDPRLGETAAPGSARCCRPATTP